jgi:phospholipid/cholesterol/gamma-HCH transport system ATP-binding protein
MASSYFDTEKNQMMPLTDSSKGDLNTTFLILRDGKVIFDGTVHELVHSDDEYIREYIA